MRALISLTRFIIVISLLGVAHIAVSSLLPFPYSTINILFVVFCLHILLIEKGHVVWLAFATHFIIELYGTLTFGITLFSATMAVLMGFWLFEAVFTNRSWYTASALSVCMFVLYRLIYAVLLFGMQRFSVEHVVWRPILLNFAWEILFSTVAVTVLYLMIYRYEKTRKRHDSIFMRI